MMAELADTLPVFFFILNTPIAIAIGLASLVTIIVQGEFSLMMVIQRMVSGTDSFPSDGSPSVHVCRCNYGKG